MKDKALANIKAAGLLADNAFYDSVASRAYYALYLMGWYMIGRYGDKPPDRAKDGGYYWKHDTFHDMLYNYKLLEGDIEKEQWEWLRCLRIKADYETDVIEKDEALQAISLANGLIAHFLDEEKGAQ
ncbi:MAG: HEPN domain-containing protein [Deltaproteobacteria bacterium]|nr:HEPN domain-containing protein [Deltaproteobacteria bacterium]